MRAPTLAKAAWQLAGAPVRLARRAHRAAKGDVAADPSEVLHALAPAELHRLDVEAQCGTYGGAVLPGEPLDDRGFPRVVQPAVKECFGAGASDRDLACKLRRPRRLMILTPQVDAFPFPSPSLS